MESPQTATKRIEYLSIISKELDLAEQVIKDYLTFSKPSLEKVESISVMNELTLIVKMLKPTANQYSVAIETKFDKMSYIIGDRQKFY